MSASEGDQSRRWHRSCRRVQVPTCPAYLGESEGLETGHQMDDDW